ncbi:class I SAM-dependent methyltransferase [Candidatus Poribacteria bacterium]|nr:class I SAM-dependent methyltransferase [Candidatus Poribacteria bacterium]
MGDEDTKIHHQSHSTEEWLGTFRDREKRVGGIVPYFVYTVYNMRHFLNQIRRAGQPGSRLLEIGCGPCFLSIWLSHLSAEGFRCWALERDEKVLEYAHRNVEFLRAPVSLIHGDMFDLPLKSDSFDIIIHDGVLEHFTDTEIMTAIKEQARVAKRVVFTVPVSRSRGNPELYGDERLLDIRHWKRVVESSGVVRVKCMYGTSPSRGLLSQVIWYGMGRVGLQKHRTSLAAAVTFTLIRRNN